MQKYTVSIIFTIILSLLFASNLPAKQRGIKVTAKTPAGEEIPLYRNSYAFVVGNGNYTNGWDPLPGAIRDVKDVARALEENGFNVVLKTDLTRDEFNRAFGNFCYKYGKDVNNRILFYYAGHGHTQKMFTGEDLGCLVMVDAPVPEKDPMSFRLASVDMQAIVNEAKMIKARHALFMFDSCFSGSILNLRERVVPEIITASVRLPVRQFITAGRANEPVPDHSVFKQAFLDLLEGRDKEPIPDGYITGEELGLYLKNKVPEYNPAQHPQYGKIKDVRLDKGDFVFALKTPTQPSPQYDRLIEKRERLEQERRELERLKTEIERRRIEAERERLKDEKKRLEVASIPKNPEPPNSAFIQISCSDVNYGNPKYHQKMDELAERAGLPGDYWNRYHESVVGALCSGDIRSVDELVDAGYVKPQEAQGIAKVFGKSYKSKQRSEMGKRYGYSRVKFLDMGACDACAGNIAQFYAEKPNSPCGRLAKQAIEGNPDAITRLVAFPDYCQMSD